MADQPVGCAHPIGATVGTDPAETNEQQTTKQKEKKMSLARVGAKAPDFEAPAYYKGGFTSVKLSDFLGKWVVLCFYPGDFTFV